MADQNTTTSTAEERFDRELSELFEAATAEEKLLIVRTLKAEIALQQECEGVEHE